MDGILKALGFDSKPDYTEKIPETLTPDHFSVHNVSRMETCVDIPLELCLVVPNVTVGLKVV